MGARLTSKIPFPFPFAKQAILFLFCFVFCTTGFYLPIKALFLDGYIKRLLFEMIVLLLLLLTVVRTATYVQKCIQWRKWRKIARGLEIQIECQKWPLTRMAIAFLDISRRIVGFLTAKREVLGWIPGVKPILRELPFVLKTARPSRGSDSHMRKHGGRFSKTT